jgi:hypothetical protein
MKRAFLSEAIHMKRVPLKPVVSLLFVLALLLGGTRAEASIIVFTNRVAFDTAFPGAVHETWNEFAAGTVFPNGSTVNGITYNSSNGNALVTNAFLSSTPPNGLGETTNGFFVPGDMMKFTFIQPLEAFGIDINTFDPSATGGYTATTNLGDVIPSAGFASWARLT